MSYFTPFLNEYILQMIIRVNVSGDDLTTDNWGNPIPTFTQSDIICYVKDKGSKGDRRDSRPGGVGVNATYLEGFLVHPMQYPDSVKPPFEYPAELDVDNEIIKGAFHALPRVPQPYEKNYTGERIAGWFVASS